MPAPACCAPGAAPAPAPAPPSVRRRRSAALTCIGAAAVVRWGRGARRRRRRSRSGGAGPGPARRHRQRRFRLPLSRRLAERLGAEPRLTLNYDAAERWYARRLGDARRSSTGGDSYTQLLGYGGCVDAGLRGHAASSSARRIPLRRRFGLRLRGSVCRACSASAGARVCTTRRTTTAAASDGLPRAQRPRSARRTQPACSRHFGVLASAAAAPSARPTARAATSALGAGLVCAPGTCISRGSAATRGGPYPAVYSGRRERARRGRVVLFLIGVDTV